GGKLRRLELLGPRFRGGDDAWLRKEPMNALSPLAPERFPELVPIAGVRLATFACGIRYAGRDDLMLAELAPDSSIAGVFTRSLTAGAPVLWCRDCLPSGKVRGIVVNSGNSNTFT